MKSVFFAPVWWVLMDLTVLPSRISSTKREISTICSSTLCRWRLWWHFPVHSLVYVMHAHVDVTSTVGACKGCRWLKTSLSTSLSQVKWRLQSLLDTNVTACIMRRHVFLALNSKHANWGKWVEFFSYITEPFTQLSKCQHCLSPHRGESNVSKMSILGYSRLFVLFCFVFLNQQWKFLSLVLV